MQFATGRLAEPAVLDFLKSVAERKDKEVAADPWRFDRALVLALARARSWMRSLRQAEFVDTAEIAQRFALCEPHVRRLLRFVYLAPDIVEAIVEGRQPRILTVKLLLRGIDEATRHPGM